MDTEIINSFANLGGIGLLGLAVWLEVRQMRISFVNLIKQFASNESREKEDSDRLIRIENTLVRIKWILRSRRSREESEEDKEDSTA